MVQFTAAQLDEIKSGIVLSDVIGQDVKLRRSGKEFVGLSPFQTEETPSFTVNDDKRFFYCFSSKRNGDIFEWLRFRKGCTFPEAVVVAAEMANVVIDRGTPSGYRGRRQGVLKACHVAASYFASRLTDEIEGEPGRAYLAGRGVATEAMTQFQLGWAPARSGGLLNALSAAGVTKTDARAAGLFVEKSVASFFRERVMFPIRDAQSRVIGFGGRTIQGPPGGAPKYLNSRETDIFKKRSSFFNLDLARPAAAMQGRVIVVEGYLDVLSMVRAGFHETVGTLGTAIDQSALAKAMPGVDELVVLMDGDRAGEGASERVVEAALPDAGPRRFTRFARLPRGQDPDSFLRGHPPAEMRAIVDDALSLEAALWHTAVSKFGHRSSPEGRAALIEYLRERIDTVNDDLTREWFQTMMVRRIEKHFGRVRTLDELADGNHALSGEGTPG